MLKTGILNPQLASLLAHVRHTNTLVIADRGFPFWPGIETVDLSIVDNLPTVLQVLAAIRPNYVIGKAWMAQEFLKVNTKPVQKRFITALRGASFKFEPHGLIRTGDATPYANMILESA
jgi:D-ribose pyranase